MVRGRFLVETKIKQQLNPTGHSKGRAFVKCIRESPADVFQKLIFPYSRIWARKIHKSLFGDVMGSYFFEKAVGKAVTVNCIRHHQIITKPFPP